jgi:hypothetical protein
MNAAASMRRIFVAGRAVEVWEDLETPFGWTAEHLHVYGQRGAWGLLFNALLLASSQPQETLGC